MSVFGIPVFSSNSSQSSVASISATANTSIGDLIVIGGRCNGLTTTITPSDTIGNSFTSLTAQKSNDGTSMATVQMFWAVSTGANAANSVKLTFTPSDGFVWIAVWDIAITGGTSSFDTQAGAVANTGVTSLASSAFTTTGTDELVLVCCSPNALAQTTTFTAGYTLDSSSIGGFGGAAHQAFSSTQSGITVTGSWQSSISAGITVAAFKGTASAPSNDSCPAAWGNIFTF